METNKVLRIQHVKDKSGPFVSDNPYVRKIVDNVNLPAPHEDKGFDESAIKRLRDEKASPIKFAFKDKKQMGKTFSDKHLATLKEHGYEPTWVDAKESWPSDRQVMYTTHAGDKKHADRQAKYGKKNNYREFSQEEIAQRNAQMNKSLIDKLIALNELLEIREDLEKAIGNMGGIGGVGSVKSGASLPSIKSVSSAGKPAGNNSATSSVGIAQPSKKNPLKQAQQIQNKDIKDIKLKEAQSVLKDPVIKFDSNGQWSLDKISEPVATMSFDDATVNQKPDKGIDINVANKQPK